MTNNSFLRSALPIAFVLCGSLFAEDPTAKTAASAVHSTRFRTSVSLPFSDPVKLMVVAVPAGSYLIGAKLIVSTAPGASLLVNCSLQGSLGEMDEARAAASTNDGSSGPTETMSLMAVTSVSTPSEVAVYCTASGTGDHAASSGFLSATRVGPLVGEKI
jgi:hypothetical protein